MGLTRKQAQIFRTFIFTDPKILVCSGAKRAGKTYIVIFLFLTQLAKHQNKGLNFVIGGVDQASIKRNILDEIELMLGIEIKLNKSNAFKLFGNNVYCFRGANTDSWKSARGFTSAGALMNEGTALADTFIKEIISRCSYPGAKIFLDTNPENPTHYVKTDYIDKSGQQLRNGTINILNFDFSIYDNETLDPEYVESIIAATPSGMFTDRDIYGKWVAAEGVVYKDFDRDENIIEPENVPELINHFAGVDWGYKHFGTIVLVGEDAEGNYYANRGVFETEKHIDYWVEQARAIIAEVGDIPFYCDTARPEYLETFRRAGIKAINADKSVIAGIGSVASLIKTRQLKIVKDTMPHLINELYNYIWHEKTGQPVKEHDDGLDALRYAIYTNQKIGSRRKVNYSGKRSR